MFDTCLHASMAEVSTASIGAYVRSLAARQIFASGCWFDRLPSSPELEDLGRGIGRAECHFYSRMGELTRRFFDSLDWDADEFIGFRCVVEYPMTGVEYAVSFEFTQREGPGSSAAD